MPLDLPDAPRALLIVLGVFVVLALAGWALPRDRRSFHIGLIAATVAVLTTLVFWQMSLHSSWTRLFFQLFPAPALDESARLIALFVLPAAALHDRRAWIMFALGFAVLQAGAGAWLSLGAVSPITLLMPLVLLAMHFALGFGALALKARGAPPLLIFCALAIVHGAINGAWIALIEPLQSWIVVGVEAFLIVIYAALCFVLWRSDPLRDEDRSLD